MPWREWNIRTSSLTLQEGLKEHGLAGRQPGPQTYRALATQRRLVLSPHLPGAARAQDAGEGSGTEEEIAITQYAHVSLKNERKFYADFGQNYTMSS